MNIKKLLIAITAWLPSFAALATDDLIRIETRPGVQVAAFYMKREAATATVILLPGGAGSFGKLVAGQPTGRNFLVRARDHFAEAGLNVAVMNRPSDKHDLDYPDRVSAEHLQDIKKLVDHVKADTGLPVWLVGTSRGTVSATAAAVKFGNTDLAGIVLSSSVVSDRKVGAVPTQDLAAIQIPVLVLRHPRNRS